VNIHFVSGLPRSGSTMFTAGVLGQNPALASGKITTPLGSIVNVLLEQMSQKLSTSVQFSDEQRVDILRAVFEAFHKHEIAEDRIVINYHRYWCGKMALLARLFPASKVVACVRHVPWIYDSCEVLLAKNSLHPSGMFGFDPRLTVYERFNLWRDWNGLVGTALHALKQGFYGDYAARLMLVRYETMVKEPQEVMRQVYQFLELPYYEHDFNKLNHSAPATDDRLGTPGLHDVRPVLSYTPRASVLPPDLWKRAEVDTFWEGANPRGVLIV
jgi:sulfotransferase